MQVNPFWYWTQTQKQEYCKKSFKTASYIISNICNKVKKKDKIKTKLGSIWTKRKIRKMQQMLVTCILQCTGQRDEIFS